MGELLIAYRTLVGLALGCGLVIATVFEVSRAPIEHNRAQALGSAITRVLPGSVTRQGLTLTDQDKLARIPEPTSQADVYRTRDTAGNLLGFAIVATGMGYQDQIRLLYGYDPSRGHLTGYVVLESRETPGLGSRIGTDKAFLARFKGLGVRWVRDTGELAPALRVVRPGTSNQPSEIDGITGATVSSRAVVSILNDSLRKWLPGIHAEETEQ